MLEDPFKIEGSPEEEVEVEIQITIIELGN